MLRQGTRAQVMHGTALKTTGGLRRNHLKYNKQGKIVSRLLSTKAKKDKRLERAGWTVRKGEFGAVQMKGGLRKGYTPNKKYTIIKANREKYITKIPKEIAKNFENQVKLNNSGTKYDTLLKENVDYKKKGNKFLCNHSGIVKLYIEVLRLCSNQSDNIKKKIMKYNIKEYKKHKKKPTEYYTRAATTTRTRVLTDYLGLTPQDFIKLSESENKGNLVNYAIENELIDDNYVELARGNTTNTIHGINMKDFNEKILFKLAIHLMENTYSLIH